MKQMNFAFKLGFIRNMPVFQNQKKQKNKKQRKTEKSQAFWIRDTHHI